MKELTLRQMEVVRTVMIAGSIQGAVDPLHGSAPGISRFVMHTEDGLGFRRFERRAGVFVPAPEAIVSDQESLWMLLKGTLASPLSLVLFISVVLIFVSKTPLWGMIFRKRAA